MTKTWQFSKLVNQKVPDYIANKPKEQQEAYLENKRKRAKLYYRELSLEDKKRVNRERTLRRQARNRLHSEADTPQTPAEMPDDTAKQLHDLHLLYFDIPFIE